MPRNAIFRILCLGSGILVMTGCSAIAPSLATMNDQFNRPGTWNLEPGGGAVEQNLDAQVVNPEDLMHGHATTPPGTFGGEFADQAVRQVANGGGSSSSGGASSGSGDSIGSSGGSMTGGSMGGSGNGAQPGGL